MSALTIAPYFPFRRIKIINQQVLPDASEARIFAQPDKRFQPLCHFCSQKASAVHSWSQRTVRDLNLASAKVWVSCQYRKLFCPHCQHISIEDLELFHPYLCYRVA
jgi:transposase